MTTVAPAPSGLEFISRMSLPQLCGQLLVVGFDGTTLPEDLANALAAGLRAGVVLFRRNLPNIETAWSLCKASNSVCPPKLAPIIALDQEGGRVSRLPEPVRALPPMRMLGTLGDVNLVMRAASMVARSLAALGFNCNFAPVLDVDSNPRNPVIGDRSFSSDPRLAAHLGLAFARGLSQGGIIACGKHFPGHGDTEQDSHFELPTVNKSRQELESIELFPFREAAARQIDALMTAHVVYPELDSTGVAATFSRQILTELLRDSWGYQGVVFSDDLDMKAVSQDRSLEQCAKLAVHAGCDVLLICHNTGAADRVLDSLVSEAEANPAFCARVLQAAQRNLTMRQRYPSRPAMQSSALEYVLLGQQVQQFFDELEERTQSLIA
jgi:beta-N-acetylhexosaminidase